MTSRKSDEKDGPAGRAAALYRRALGRARSLLRRGRATMESTFEPFYAQNLWGDEESGSGPGSSLAKTARLRRELPALLSELRVRTLLDAPCGDFNWMRETALDLELYTGADVVRSIVERNRRLYEDARRRFLVLDVTRDRLPRADLVLCRDMLVHLSFRHAAAAIENFRRSGSEYLLTSTYPGWTRNEDVSTGGFRPLNLQLPPFDFPPPLRFLDEKEPDERAHYHGKGLGLWRLADLQGRLRTTLPPV